MSDGTSTDSKASMFSNDTIHSAAARYATISYLSITALLGILGNILVIVSVIKTTKLHHLTFLLILNLSVVSLLICVTVIPFHVVNIINTQLLNSRRLLCNIEAFFNVMFTTAVLANTSAIALSRYLTVNRNIKLQLFNNRFKIMVILVLLWIIPASLASGSLSITGYNKNILDCFFIPSTTAYWHVTMVTSIPAMLTTILICSCYSLILRKVHRSRLRVTGMPDNQDNRGRDTNACFSTSQDIVQHNPGSCSDDVESKIYQSEQPLNTMQNTEVSVTEASKSVFPEKHVTFTKPPTTRLAITKFQKEVRLTLQLLLVFFLFCALYLPMFLVQMLHVLSPVSADVWLTLYTLSLSFSTITWMLYATFNKDFRTAYSKIFVCLKNRAATRI